MFVLVVIIILDLKLKTRIELFFDKDSFKSFGENIKTINPLSFEGYEDKLSKSINSTESSEAVVTGVAYCKWY